MSKEMFDKIIVFTLQHEGGYSNDTDDPGGETQFGIARRYHENLDIKNLTLEQAKKIYYKEYWVSSGCDDLPDRTAMVMFECAVNPGRYRAVQFLQRVIGVFDDGILGPKTLKAVESYSDLHMSLLVIDERIKYYQQKVTESPIKVKYLRGWLSRCEDLRKLIRGM